MSTCSCELIGSTVYEAELKPGSGFHVVVWSVVLYRVAERKSITTLSRTSHGGMMWVELTPPCTV